MRFEQRLEGEAVRERGRDGDSKTHKGDSDQSEVFVWNDVGRSIDTKLALSGQRQP